MRCLRRSAKRIAEQQIRVLVAQAGSESGNPWVEGDVLPVVELLVVGDNQRPYVVRRLLIRRPDGSWLSWVSVSAADWTRTRRRPVTRTAITPPEPPAFA